MTTQPSHDPYEMIIRVQPTDIDEMGHVNNVIYLRWVQEVATAHWFAAATEEQKASLLWVVARHEIDFLRPAMPDQDIVLRTWVGQAAGRHFTRHVEILRQADGKPLARALSHWVPVDTETKRPVKAGPDVYAMFSRED
jgi:acyl-CoA thioester hydrolase